MQWWQSVLHIVSSAAWFAGFLQSLLGSGVALIGAVIILRYQLRHDRELAVRQVKIERQVDATTTLGRKILAVVDEFQSLAPDDLFDLVQSSSDSARPESKFPPSASPGTRKIARAIESAAVVADLSPKVFDALRLDRDLRWNAIQVVHLIKGEGQPPENHSTAVAVTAIKLIKPSQVKLAEFGRALCRWNGDGEPPDLNLFPGWKSPDIGTIEHGYLEHGLIVEGEWSTTMNEFVAEAINLYDTASLEYAGYYGPAWYPPRPDDSLT